MKKRTILYIGWVGFANHGDDLTHDIFLDLITKEAKKNKLELDIKALYPSNFNEYLLARINPDLVVLGAGSLFEPVYLKPLVLAQQQGIPTVIWGSGYDSIAEGDINSSQIDPDSAYMIRQVVTNANLVGVRGPFTKQMLDNIGASHPQLHISGDPGLLLKATRTKKNTSPTIAVNWGTAFNRVYGGNETTAMNQLAKALDKLLDFQIIIYPVWERDIESCRELYEAINNKESVILLEQVPSPQELIDLYLRSKLTINMKLHANVFSAALNRPFICLAYRLKGLDFAASLNLSDLAFPLSTPKLSDKILGAVRKVSQNPSMYIERINQQKTIYEKHLLELIQGVVKLLI